MDHSCIDKQTFVQQLLRGRERVLLTSVAAQRSLPFADGVCDYTQSAGDGADGALSCMFGDLRTLAAKRELTELAAIRRALVRLEGGTYGTCDHCGAEIPTERLKAQPAATCCPSCQSVRERTYP